MTDEQDKQDGEVPVRPASGPQAGERLAEARRKAEITISEIAKELHLDEFKVRALENNDFDVLGAPVFAKGHLRKYAQLVGVSIDDVMAEYYMLNRSVGAPPVVGKVRKPAREIAPGPWLIAVAALILLMVVYWYFAVRDPDPVAPVIEAQPPAAVAEPPPATNEIAADRSGDAGAPGPTDVVDDATGRAAAVPEVGPETTAEASPEPPPATGQIRLQMRFSGDCWTEITDANGRRLFFDLGRDGRSVTVSGEAPLSALFGNADNVVLSVNGEAFAIDPSNRRRQTARLTIYAP